MADAELGVMLEPTNDLQDEVGDVQADVTGGGGAGQMTAADQQQQESVVAGGVSKGLVAAGVIGAVLSQLKSITGIVSAVFGAISRSLVPIVESLADLLRPLIQGVNQVLQSPERLQESMQIQGRAANLSTGLSSLPLLGAGVNAAALNEQLNLTPEGEDANAVERGFNAFSEFIFGNTGADQTGEANKQQARQNLEDPVNDRAGGFEK
jgi:hypothetical protein